MHPTSALKQQGLSLLEVLIAVAIAGVLMAAITGVVGSALNTERGTRVQNDSLQQARFAMQRMVNAVSNTRRLMIPLGENPVTVWKESERNVLAVTLDPTLDRDKDGWADANNDKDYLDVNKNFLRNTGEPERIDEDPGGDVNKDAAPGILGLDDDGDGLVDEQHTGTPPINEDDDEDGTANEDAWNNIDEDLDNSLDEDPKKDMTSDALPGIGLIDDDGDGTIDEGNQNDDDEDGFVDEDWLDTVVFYLNGTTLMERMPNINPASGTDYSEYPIADNVSQLLVKRITGGNGTTALVDITLTLTPPNAEPVSLNTRIGIASGL